MSRNLNDKNLRFEALKLANEIRKNEGHYHFTGDLTAHILRKAHTIWEFLEDGDECACPKFTNPPAKEEPKKEKAEKYSFDDPKGPSKVVFKTDAELLKDIAKPDASLVDRRVAEILAGLIYRTDVFNKNIPNDLKIKIDDKMIDCIPENTREYAELANKLAAMEYRRTKMRDDNPAYFSGGASLGCALGLNKNLFPLYGKPHDPLQDKVEEKYNATEQKFDEKVKILSDAVDAAKALDELKETVAKIEDRAEKIDLDIAEFYEDTI